jgi:organic radical activating enzyme
MGEIEAMLDAVVRNEGEPDIVQVSGGEPTLHPQFFEILDAAKRRPIRHLMVNTNGLRLANDRDFAKRLAGYMPSLSSARATDTMCANPASGFAYPRKSTVNTSLFWGARFRENSVSSTPVKSRRIFAAGTRKSF